MHYSALTTDLLSFQACLAKAQQVEEVRSLLETFMQSKCIFQRVLPRHAQNHSDSILRIYLGGRPFSIQARSSWESIVGRGEPPLAYTLTFEDPESAEQLSEILIASFDMAMQRMEVIQLAQSLARFMQLHNSLLTLAREGVRLARASMRRVEFCATILEEQDESYASNGSGEGTAVEILNSIADQSTVFEDLLCLFEVTCCANRVSVFRVVDLLDEIAVVVAGSSPSVTVSIDMQDSDSSIVEANRGLIGRLFYYLLELPGVEPLLGAFSHAQVSTQKNGGRIDFVLALRQVETVRPRDSLNSEVLLDSLRFGICKQIVEAYDGQLLAKALPDGGLDIRFSLPASTLDLYEASAL